MEVNARHATTREIWDHQTRLLAQGARGASQLLGEELLRRTDRSPNACARDRRAQAARAPVVRLPGPEQVA